MWLSNISIDNKVAIYILILLIVIMGVGAYSGLPREASPDITIPLVVVTVPYIGVSPIDIEGLVTQPLERSLKALKDIKQITSVSKEGLSTIRVEFNTGVDMEEALRRVRDKVNSARTELPNDILEPIVSEINISEFPIMYVNVMGDLGLARLKDIAEKLQDRIESIPGVLRADIAGGLEPEVQVNCDVNRLNAYQISFDDVVNAIRSENLSIPGGTIDDGTRTFSVRIPGEYKEVRPIEEIVIKVQNGKPIYIYDVAQVEYSFEDRISYARLNQKEVVSVQVRKRANENLLRIADEVQKVVESEQQRLGNSVEIEISNDQSVFIKRLVKELENSIMTGMFLVVVTLFMFFGFKNSLLISTAIPISMFIGFIVMTIANITLNFVTLFSLVFVLGILVDDAIVVIENIYRHQQEYGKRPIQAAKTAVKEVAMPVATSTLTTLTPFIPLLFWPGVVGEFMWFLPMTLIITLLASLFTAFVISPVQGAIWINYRKEIARAKEDLAHPKWYKKYNPVTYLYHKTDEVFFPAAQELYVKTLKYTLDHKGKTLVFSFLLLVMVFFLFGIYNTGLEFFPVTEPSNINIGIEAPTGTSLAVTNEISKDIEKRVSKIPGSKDLEFLSGRVGVSEDIFDFGGQGIPNKGIVAINFFKKEERHQSTFRTLEEIRDNTATIVGANLKITKQEMGPPAGAPVSIEISGEDYIQLANLAGRIRKIIKDIPGLVDLKDDYNAGKPEIQIIVDREKAGMLYTSTAQIAMTIRSAISGAEASKFRIGEDEYKIRVRLREDQRTSVDDIGQVRINFMNRRGQMISLPVTAVAEVKRTQGLTEIRRKDQKRVITVTGNTEGRVSSAVLNDIKTKLAGFELPSGYNIKFTGRDEEQQKAANFLGRAFTITLLLVFLILVAEFNSVKVPIVIMLSVPLSLIGVLIGQMVTSTPLIIILTGVGVVALAGIVVRNAIVLLDFAKHKIEEGVPLKEALIEAGRVRLRPVVLTAAATVLAVTPLATGIDFDWAEGHFIIGAESASFWGPLGVAIISGLTVSTFLTLVIIPTVYLEVASIELRIKNFLTKRFGMQFAESPALEEKNI